MKIYIAALYSRRFELRAVHHRLEAMGHELTSQWVWNAEESKGLQAGALMDVEDVRRADAILFFGQPKGSYNTGGGRWFELGLAFAENKRIFAVIDGGAESLFLHLPGVNRFDNLDAALAAIGPSAAPPESRVPPEHFVGDRYEGGDPAAVQRMILFGKEGHRLYTFSSWERDVIQDAVDAGRFVLEWDRSHWLDQFGAKTGLTSLKRVRTA